MAENLDLLSEFPLLVPQNSKLTAFQGFITISGVDYGLKVSLPDASMHASKFSCDIKLRNLIRGCEGIIAQRLYHAKNLCTFLRELKTFAENLSTSVSPDHSSVPRPSSVYFKTLIEHIEGLGWDKVVEIDGTFTRLKLEAVDSLGTRHLLTLAIPGDYNRSAPGCHCDLPMAFEPSWQEYCSTLTSVYNQFKNVVEGYQDFWSIMGELDKNTWVIDSGSVTQSSVSRRIVVADNASMLMKVDPRNPRMFPEIRFLGADKSIQPIRERLNRNVDLWDNQRTLLENLASVLAIEFPQKTETSQGEEDATRGCGICYSYQLRDHVPGKACDDVRCGQVYHQECLYEWLRSLTTSRQSFDQLFGECPYCTRPITVDVRSGKHSNMPGASS